MEKKVYNLTFPQENILFMERYNNNSSVNVISGLVNIYRNFDIKACNLAINEVIKTNDIMRGRVFEESGKFFQYIEEYEEKEFEIVEMSSMSKSEILEYIDGMASQPLFSYNKQLYEFKILKYSDKSGSIFMRINHIISDAWSCSKIGTQLINILENKSEISDNKPSYIEFINSENEYKLSEKFVKDSEFWKEYLQGINDTISLKDAKSNISTMADRYSVKLEENINSKILEYCKENKVSPYALFLAAFSTYIYRIKDKNDFVIGTPVLNRSNFKEKQMLGMFVSTLPLRIKINEGEKFLELTKNIGRDTLSVFRHQKYPYMKNLEYIRKNTEITSNLYSMVLSYQNARADMVDETKYSTSWAFSKELQDDLQIHIMDMDDSGILNINYDYKTELFERIEIEYLHTRLLAIIENAINDLEVNVENIRIMSKEEENKILYEFNDTKRDYPKDKTVIELFEEQVEKTPDNIALVFENKTMTYKELNEKANQLAHFLIEEKKVKPNDVVGIMLNKSFELIISILACLKSRVCYLPIEVEYPYERKKYMIDDANVTIVLVDEIYESEEFININLISNDNISNLNLAYNVNDDVYIMYTSGTTGKPKGVIIGNNNIVRLVKNTNYISFFSYDRIIQTGASVFDASTFEYWGALLNGISLYLIKKEELLNPKELENFLMECCITIMWLTAPLFNQMVEYNSAMFKKLRVLLVGGDVLSSKHINKVKDSCPKLTIINGYGPTENTTFSCCYNISKNYNTSIPIGKPIANSRAYIIDRKNRLMPINTFGELLVAGDGISKGYINREELTKEKFIEVEFENKKSYKTGDIALYNNDGNIIFKGRIDNQVKINGFRIELDEIKSITEKIDGIDSAIVLTNNKRIELYYTSIMSVDSNFINEVLSTKLPKYMLPKKIIRLSDIPLNINGKIDKNKINEYIIDEKKQFKVNNINYTELTIIDKLKEVLDVENIDINTNLLEYGMDSLNSINIAINLSNYFSIDISPKDIFSLQTIKRIALYIENKDKNINYKKMQKQEEYPLSSSQFGIFTNYSLNPDSIVYNIPFEMKFSKDINVNKLRESLEKVIMSTDTFFTTIYIKDGVPFQKIDKSKKFDIDIINISEKDYILEKEKLVKSFDLLNDLLFDIKIILTEKNTYVFVNIHHIIFDGLSMNIFLDKLKKAYENVELEKDEFVLGQFVVYEKNTENTDRYKEAKEYFNNIFSEELPDNNMILDGKREKEKNYEGARFNLKIDKKLSKKILNLSDNSKITLNSIFLSMFNILLSKYMYSDDIIIGMATSGRNIKEQINQIGMFVRTVPFRTKINFDSSILDYIKNIQKQVIETIDNSIYPYENIVKDLNIIRDSSRNPLFDIMFVYQNTGMPDITFDNKNVFLSDINTNTSKFDITFEVIPNNEQFDINIEYATKLFNIESIKQFGRHYLNGLEYIVDNIEKELKDIDILSKEEKNVILKKYNNTYSKYPKNKTVAQLFKEQVKKSPKNIAVVFENTKLTYIELDELSEKLAMYLSSNGVKKGDMVALMMDKSLELMISIIAILKLGAVYVPLELDFPKDRINYIIEDTKSKVILVNKEYNGFESAKQYSVIDVNLNSDIYIQSSLRHNIKSEYTSNDLAYVMYTSGTTGRPKGVMVTNSNIVRLVKNTNYISLNKNDRIIQTGAISFDASTFEFWTALLNGLELHLVKKEKILDLKFLERYVLDNKITIMWLTSKLFNNIVEYNNNFFSQLNYLLVGGDVLSVKHINIIKDKNPNLKIINGYGPTENTTFTTCYNIRNKFKNSIPIGKPISNTTCYILDKVGHLCYINMPGELVTGGDGVSKGYLNNIELTNKKFIQDKYSLSGKMYKTGDLTYLDIDGNINFCGRIDTQVKIRGFRIEPDEINLVFNNYEKIRESIVIVQEEKKEKILVAYYTSEDKNLDIQQIVKYLKSKLPYFMIPKYFVRIDRIPLNNNGKVDKIKLKQLGNKELNDSIVKMDVDFEGEYLKVYELFKEVLDNSNIGYDDNFFDCGGDSLLALKLVTNAISKNIPITYPDLFKYPTIRGLGDMLNKISNNKSICEDMYSFDYSDSNKVLKNNMYSENIKVDESIGNVLLTGVTGFLGAHILDEFMKLEKGKIYCLIREKNGKDATTRLKDTLNFFFDGKYEKEIGRRIVIIEEDITDSSSFESLEINRRYIKNINTVINSAACVKHFGSYDKFERINVNLVKSLIDFCLKYNKKLIQISTLSVSGNLLEAGQLDQSKVKPDTIFNENNLYIEQNLDNVYAYTKFLAEKLVYDAIAKDNLNAKVMRMGNLTGRTDDGKFQPNVSENAFANRLKTMLELNVLPENMLNFYLEFTPIDYAAKAVILLSRVEPTYNTFHLFNHNHAMLHFVDKVLNDKLDIYLKHISKEQMTHLIEEYSKDESGFEKIKGIVLDVNRNKELEYVSNIIVKSDFTIDVLKKFNFEWLHIDDEYIVKYINYLFEIGFLTKEEE